MFILCIIFRFSLAYLAYILYKENIRYILSFIFFIIGLGFGYLFFKKKRKKEAFIK